LPQLLMALDGVSEQFETTIVGEGSLKDELMNQVADLKLKNVKFAGQAEGDELLNFYQEAGVFVLTSEREGMPLVLLEAMAMGLPIVATNVTGSRDVVKNLQNGLLVPYQDANAFRAALLQITNDQELYEKLSHTSQKMAEQHSWSKIVAQFKSLYMETYEKA